MLANISGSDHVLRLHGLVDKDLEGDEVMKIQLTTKLRIESTSEPFLLLGVGGDLFSCITSQPVELTAILVNSPSALGEVAKFLTLAVHKTLRNVMLTECSAELIPCCGWTFGTHVEIILPPRACCTLKVVGGIGDFVAICNMSCLKLSLDAAKPIIGVKGLGGMTEYWGMKLDEVIQRHKLILLRGSVPSNDLQ